MFNDNVVVSLPVSTNLAGSEGKLVKMTSTGIALTADVNDRAIGVLRRANNTRDDGGSYVGDAAAVKLLNGAGLHEVIVGNTTAIAVGDELEQGTTDGTVVKRVNGQPIGIAVSACPATSTGGAFSAILFPTVGGTLANIEVLTAAKTLTSVDSGKTFYLDLAGGFTVTLPANATAGFKATFIVKTAPTTAYILLAATADTIIGYPVASTGGDESANGNAAGDQVNFVANTALPSDRVDVEFDGTSVHVRATCKATGAITITG